MDNKTKKIIENKMIPTPPGVAMELLRLTQSPDSSGGELADVISADPKLSAIMINYCNSPLLGIPRKINSLQQAINLMGRRAVTLLGLSFSLMDNNGSKLTFDYDEFWKSSLAFAIACKVISKSVAGDEDEDFLLGLLLNIGLIAIAVEYDKELAEQKSDDSSQQSQDLTLAKIIEQNDFDPYFIGGKLLESWNFPQDMSDFVAEFASADQTSTRVIGFHAAKSISEILLGEQTCLTDIEAARSEVQQAMNWREEQFDLNFDAIAEEYGDYASLLEFEQETPSSIADLEKRAKDILIQTSLGMATEIKEISQEREQLKNDSLVDALTGLSNRRAYDAEVPCLIKESRSACRPFGLVVIDIDHFKSFNDNHGHAAGDEVLREVAQTLKSNSRKVDYVYRFGGEEFVVVLSDCTPEETRMITERLRKAVESLSVKVEEKTLSVTVSSGVAWIDPKRQDPLEAIFGYADGLLYEAKKSGRNRCHYSFTGNPLPENAVGPSYLPSNPQQHSIS